MTQTNDGSKTESLGTQKELEPQNKIALGKLEDLKDAATLVQKYAKALGNDERAQQFAAHISIMAQRDEKFHQANPESVVAAMMSCVHLDLMPNTPEQHAYLIPYKFGNMSRYDIQFQLGYKGLLALALRSGQIKTINAEVVFEGDIFDVDLGTERRLTHKPNFDTDRTNYGLVTHAYMTAKLVNGETVFEVMTRKELDKIRESSKAKSTDTPWEKWPIEMAKKTVIKRATKLLPSNKEDNRLQFAAALDSWSEAGKLRFQNGELVEGEAIDNAVNKRDIIAEAEKKRRQMLAENFTPKPVESQE